MPCCASALEEYAHNGLIVPRYVVGQCAAHAGSQAMTGRLAVLQTARLQSEKACCFPLLHGEHRPSQTKMLLVMADTKGYAWVSHEVLQTMPAGSTAQTIYESLHLSAFGLHGIQVAGLTLERYPFLQGVLMRHGVGMSDLPFAWHGQSGLW